MANNTLYITFTEELNESDLGELYELISEFAQVDDTAHITESNEVVNTTSVNLCEADNPDHFCYEFTILSLEDGDNLYTCLEDVYLEVLEGMEYITETDED